MRKFCFLQSKRFYEFFPEIQFVIEKKMGDKL